jgi:hypothetical protein
MTATTRRAALGALAGASALALPAVAIAATSSPDAELFAMQAEIEAADEHQKAMIEAQNRADTVYHTLMPPRPSKPSEEALVLNAKQLEQLERFRLSLEEVDARS